MLKADYLLLAEDVKLDDTGRTSIINIAERLNAPGVPVALDNIKITARLHPEGEPIVNETFDIRFVIRLGDKDVQEIQIEQTLTMELGTGWAPILDVDDLVFPEFGDYRILLLVNGQELASTMLTVKSVAELSEP